MNRQINPMSHIKQARLLLALLLVAWAGAGHGEPLQIEVTQGEVAALPVAIVPFGGVSLAVDMAQVIDDDLGRSGRIRTLERGEQPQRTADAETVRWNAWQQAEVDYIVLGEVQPAQDKGADYQLVLQIFDSYRRQRVAGFRIPVEQADVRHAAHIGSNLIYEELLGLPGAFDGRIAYVSAQVPSGQVAPSEYQLIVADADGQNTRTILRSAQPILSPRWSADGNRLAYVSYRDSEQTVFIQDLRTGQRRALPSTVGVNGAPDFSPDGSQLALAVSEGMDTNLYLMDLGSGQMRRLTRTSGIDTEPDFSPDGQRLVFTSDRSGAQQVYEMELASGRVRRVTRQGRANLSPRYSPDGQSLVLVHQDAGYRIALLDLAGGELEVIGSGPLDESPDFAPNGDIILFAAKQGGRNQLFTVSSDGAVRQRMLGAGQIQSPAWAPARP